MKRSFFLLLTLALLVLPNTSSAAVISRDWENAPSGNGLLTFDNVNNREWLDLSETLLEQFPGADPGATLEVDLEARYQNVVAELVVGGMFEGFTVGKQDDVVALAQSAGIDTETRDFATNGVATENLVNLLEVTTIGAFGLIGSFGFLDEPGPSFQPPPSRLAMLLLFNPAEGSIGIGRAGVLFGGDDRVAKSTIGVMLYRQIPEPSSAALMALCLASIATIRYRRLSHF